MTHIPVLRQSSLPPAESAEPQMPGGEATVGGPATGAPAEEGASVSGLRVGDFEVGDTPNLGGHPDIRY